MIRILILCVALAWANKDPHPKEPIQELYPGDDMFASPEAYGLQPTDYSEEIPPIHTHINEVNHEGLIEEQIMKEINAKPIFHYGVSVLDELCDEQCNFHGDCQRALKDI